MALKYSLKEPEGLDAFAAAGIATATDLRESSGLSRALAQAAFRGDPVTRTTAIRVVNAVCKDGREVAFTEIFEEVKP